MNYRLTKYHNKKTTVNGEVFDSKKEAKRCGELLLLQKAGAISDLERQVKFVLIPAQREADTVGPRGGIKKGNLLEKECAYIADFVYWEGGKMVVEDTKGFRTADYIIKRKLMLHVFGIKIKEI